MYYLPYNLSLRSFSRDLRNHSTAGEILLWKQLRAGGMMGYQFNRQKPLGNYIVDFYCKPLNLVIEVDGGYHNTKAQKMADKERQSILETLNLRFLRFSEEMVLKTIPEVIASIKSFIVQCELECPELKTRKSRYRK